MTASLTTEEMPGYLTGSWEIDPVHTEVSFAVRHLMVGRVRGRFQRVSGTIVLGEDPLASSVTACVDLASVDTGNRQRDDNIRSADFLDVERFPTMTFSSTAVGRDGDHFVVEGRLDLHGVTRTVEMMLEVHGFTTDPYGGMRAGFGATTQIDRRDFGVTIDLPMDGGGVVVGHEVQVRLDVEAVLSEAATDAR